MFDKPLDLLATRNYSGSGEGSPKEVMEQAVHSQGQGFGGLCNLR